MGIRILLLRCHLKEILLRAVLASEVLSHLVQEPAQLQVLAQLVQLVGGKIDKLSQFPIILVWNTAIKRYERLVLVDITCVVVTS